MYSNSLFSTIIIIFISFAVTAQQTVITIEPLKDEINFDGKLEEGFWSKMESFSTVQHVPVNGIAPSEAEEIYLTYDKDYLYLAAKIQGANIQSPSKKRDEFSLKPDWIGILIDGYNDDENALGFFTTPAALRSDFTIYEDAVGDFPVNLDWNTYWDVKTQVYSDHWTVEMRIPFSSLQFQETEDGHVKVGLIIWRAIASKNEISTFPGIKNAWGEWSAFKPSQTQMIEFQGIQKSNPVYVTPYVLAGADRIAEDDPPFDFNTQSQFSAGVDVKYNLTSNLTMDFSLNTDFAQVEADDAQINLDRFDLFFPEKRQFFQERSAIFDLRVGGSNRIFYSRRIGIDDDGNLEKIMGGIRLTGRVGSYDVGLINMTTREDNWSPKNNFSVVRLRKKVLNSNSYIGLIGTNKTNLRGENNTVYALDGTFRLRGNNLFQVRWAQSFTEGYENNALSLDPSRFFINLEKVQAQGFSYDLAYARAGIDYNPEMGFENREDYSSVFAVFGYGWLSDNDSPILQQDIRMYNFGFFRNAEGKDETLNSGASYRVEWKSGYSFEVFSYLRSERLFEEVEILDGYTVPAGLYPINVWSSSFNFPGSRQFQYGFSGRFGDLFDSKFFQLSNFIDWTVNPDLNIGLFYNYNPIYRSSWSNPDEVIHVHLARLKFLYAISTKLSFSGFLQGTSDGNLGFGNMRFRYNPREGVDLFVVYNNVAELDILVDQNVAGKAIPEQVLITKFTYTFRL